MIFCFKLTMKNKTLHEYFFKKYLKTCLQGGLTKSCTGAHVREEKIEIQEKRLSLHVIMILTDLRSSNFPAK